MRTVTPACECWGNDKRRSAREEEVNDILEGVGRVVYSELLASSLCPEAYLYAACRLMSVVLATAHASALNVQGKKVSDDDVLRDALAMLDDGSVLAGMRSSLMMARLQGGTAAEARQ